jgi:hypothetical protein
MSIIKLDYGKCRTKGTTVYFGRYGIENAKLG